MVVARRRRHRPARRLPRAVVALAAAERRALRERFGLIIIVAIGESVVAIGASASAETITARAAAALLAGFTIAVALWWLYFDVVALVAERVLRRAEGIDRARLARDSYTYLHFPMVGGIVFVALGLVILIHDDGHLEAGRYALYGGVATYLVAHLAFRWRNVGSINRPRAVVAAAFVVALVALRDVDALLVLLVAAGALAGLVGYEVNAYRAPRDEIRHREEAEIG